MSLVNIAADFLTDNRTLLINHLEDTINYTEFFEHLVDFGILTEEDSVELYTQFQDFEFVTPSAELTHSGLMICLLRKKIIATPELLQDNLLKNIITSIPSDTLCVLMRSAWANISNLHTPQINDALVR